jgi:hypothetical protein
VKGKPTIDWLQRPKQKETSAKEMSGPTAVVGAVVLMGIAKGVIPVVALALLLRIPAGNPVRIGSEMSAALVSGYMAGLIVLGIPLAILAAIVDYVRGPNKPTLPIVCILSLPLGVFVRDEFLTSSAMFNTAFAVAYPLTLAALLLFSKSK